MDADEVEIDEALVRLLLGNQFPDWAYRPLRRVEPEGTDNAIFRLGEDLSVRLPRRRGPTQPGGKLFDWLPTLAPLLPLAIPVPVAQGHPTLDYPSFWEIPHLGRGRDGADRRDRRNRGGARPLPRSSARSSS
jgi:aminoglycoside phosphotransferase (APT) family kinase protein